MFFPGSVIGGRYELGHLLGEGGIGTVWAAVHTVTKRRVAIKLLKHDANPNTLRRFIREARAASVVRHPNVVGVHDIVTLDDGTPALVMDLLEGETLAQRLRRGGALPLQELAETLAPVVSAVAQAHSVGIIHRDLKPDNILLAKLGDGRIAPMVLDFGIAKVLGAEEALDGGESLTRTGNVVGTPYYMSPEQAFGEKDVDARTDVWALGALLFECATGTRPIGGATIGQVYKAISAGKVQRLVDIAPALPREFAELVDRMLTMDREQRPRDLREAFELLSRMSETPLENLAPARRGPNALGNRRNRLRAGLAAAAVACLAGVVVGIAHRSPSEPIATVPAHGTRRVVAPTVNVDAPSPIPETATIEADTVPASAPEEALPAASSAAAKANRLRVRLAAARRAAAEKPAVPTPSDHATSAAVADNSLPGGVQGQIPF